MEDNKRKKESKKYTYFMETHLSNEEENIQIFIPSENKFVYSFDGFSIPTTLMSRIESQKQ